jgi:glycosyltransferase involved in cell wall biosynthesis
LEEQEVEEIQQFDIGINPLVNNEFTRGKCGYKLIQYMACAIPVVASPVGVNCDIVEQDKNGYLAATRDQWIDSLRRLADDSDLRWRLGQEGRKRVKEKYSLQAVLPRMISFYHEIVEGKH